MNGITRRQALTTGAAALVGAVPRVVTARPRAQRAVTKGRLKQSVSRWPYSKIPLPEFCRALAEMGLTAIDLLEEPDWAVARQYRLICSMGYAGGGSIPDALNVKANQRRNRPQLRADDPARRGAEGSQRHHVLRQPPRDERRGGYGQLRRRAEPGQEDRRRLTTPELFNFSGFPRVGVGDPRQAQLAVKVVF
jgi:hypothetical protein